MKYVMLVGDGMGDYPIAELGGKTPLAAAHTPHMDWIADHGELGLASTIPQGCETGSDTANLSLLGYNPKSTLTRRGPLEAASIGVRLSETDVAFRCNLVTLAKQNGILSVNDYSAGHIGTDEARHIIKDLDRALGDEIFRFYPGVSYRHLVVWHNGVAEVTTTPPHDIVGHAVGPYLDRMRSHGALLQLMDRARTILNDHPVNKKRIRKGLKPANHIWLWGQGLAPHLETFETRTGLKGAVISAVDLLRGIGVYAGLEVIRVPGATGYFDTDYEAKATYALSALEGADFVYVHVEAPDEAGHAGLLDKKISTIEAFDAKVVGKVLEGMKRFPEHRVMVTTDHYTPISLRTHTTEPIPFAICGAGISASSRGAGGFNEPNAEAQGVFVADGYKLIERLLRSSK
ncbi:MAG: cofactor-independent phosphoglycerate mutase [Deltaproteobacteria bacterium]|nr:cofactor-independent phosphoglycerate mutase [Deltaproteobacteria bacterium]MBW2259396.1 cofactor-independent phosphoglycerate mutase [Deltaproteobacteria bacterium]